MKKGTYKTRTQKGLEEIQGSYFNCKGNDYFIYKSDYGTWHLIDINIGLAIESKPTKKAIIDNINVINDKFEDYKLNNNSQYVVMVKKYKEEIK